MPLFNKRCRDYVEDDEVMSMDETEDEDMDDMEEPSHWSLIAGDTCGYKCIDWPQTFNVPNGMGVNVLNTIRVGTAGYERIGNVVNIKAVVIGYLQATNTALWSIVYDRQPNGILPTFQDIYYSVNNIGNPSATAYMLLNPRRMGRFEVLWMSKTLTGNTNGYGMLPGIYNEYIQINRTTQYKSTSSPPVIGDIATGAIYLVSSTSAVTQPSLRVIFEDE